MFLEQAQELFQGFFLIVILVGAGIYITLRLSFIQVALFPRALVETLGNLFSKSQKESEGEITPFQALATALAATVGTGNIAGVATAISLGGPGAIFWMWLSAFFGMATKYAEIVLAVHYRVQHPSGSLAGGPMYFLQKGLKQRFLAGLFAFFGALAALGIGNMVQANSVADAVAVTFGLAPLVTGLLLAAAAGLVILGGIRKIAAFTSRLVPVMALLYVGGSLMLLLFHLGDIPSALAAIFQGAWGGQAAAGGFAGAGVAAAVRFGVARGIFTNEAGLGSASIAHAVARTDHPARQGLWGLVEVFIDTHLICTLTALVLLTTGAWQTGLEGAAMTTEAFGRGLPLIGPFIVSTGLVFFAFSTLLTWSYYGERCLEYLVGERLNVFYRFGWLVFIVVGAAGGLRLIWSLADLLNGLMAIPNLVGLLGLTPLIAKLTSSFFAKSPHKPR